METNYFGALRCIKEVVPGMRQRRRGTIVNVTSIAGRTATAPMASYAASKWALEAPERVPRPGNARPSTSASRSSSPASSRLRYSARAGLPDPDSPYPHGRRLRALFAARLANPTPPSLVGDLIRDIVNGDSWQLRYPAGPDAAPILKGRAMKSDEQVVEEAGASDEAFLARMKRDFGLDLKL